MPPETARLTGATVESYRILESIGRGGMGEVYRAEDAKLGRSVAIKTLPESLISDPRARSRFLKESERSSKIVHPYVATVFDVVTHDDELLLVMELIEGRTLRDALREDHPGLDKIARYGLEITEALVAIHRAGLVHRDLKPGNVMITPDDHVKVMDFGVAEPAQSVISPDETTSTGTLTQAGVGGGTPMYMSPEQLRGAAVDARSDLFSLGIVLYEAVTGTHPFARDSVIETASAIINEAPGHGTEPETLTATGPLRHVVMRLLEKDPRRRYASSEIVLEHLRAAVEGSSVVTTGGWFASPGSRRPLFAVSATVAILAALVAGFAIVRPWLFPSSPEPSSILVSQVARRPVIAVLPFADETDDAEAAPRGEMLGTLLAASLSESSYLRSVGSDRLRDLLDGLDAGASQASQLDRVERFVEATFVLSGSLFKEGNTYLAAVDLYEGSRDAPVESYRVSAARVSALPDMITARTIAALAPALGVSQPPEETPPTYTGIPEEALLGFHRARRAAREMRLAEAIRELEAVVAAAPRFVGAHVLLAESLHTAGYGTRAREAIGRASRAAEAGGAAVAVRRQLELSRTRAVIEGDADGWVESARALVERFPDEPDLRLELARAFRRQRSLDEALVMVESALALDPADPRIILEQAFILAWLAEEDESRTAFAEAERLYEKMQSPGRLATVHEWAGRASFARAEYDAAEELFERAAEEFDAAGLWARAALARSAIGDVYLARGRLAEARERYAAVLPVARRAGSLGLVATVLNHMGGQHLARGETDEAESLLRQAISEARYLENDGYLVSPLLNLTTLLAITGRYSEARALADETRVLARKLKDSTRELAALVRLADVEYRLGRIDEALTSFRDLVELAGTNDEYLVYEMSALSGLSTVLESRGAYPDALEAAIAAAAIAAELGHPLYIGETFARRAQVATLLGRYGAAGESLGEAEAAATGNGDPLPQVESASALVRGLGAYQRGDWETAAASFERARAVSESARTQDIYVPAIVYAARTELVRGNAARAEELARLAGAEPRSGFVEQIEARIALAEILARSDRPEEASREARRVFDEASRAGLPLIAARAAALLAGLPEGSRRLDAEDFAEQGRRLLDEILGKIPDEDRPGVQGRRDVRALMEDLQFDPSSTVSSSPTKGDT